MNDALSDSLVLRMERIENLQSTYCTMESNKYPEGVDPLVTLTAEFSTYMNTNVDLEAKIQNLRFKQDASSQSTPEVEQSLNESSTTVQKSGHLMSLRVEKIRVGCVEMKTKLDRVDLKLGNTPRVTKDTRHPL